MIRLGSTFEGGWRDRARERGRVVVKNVAVVGASGAVGEVMVRLLLERNFPIGAIKFLASEQSAGKPVRFAGETYPIEPLTPEAFDGVDIVLSSTPAAVSREYSPIAARGRRGGRGQLERLADGPRVPLVVPEVNPGDVAKHHGIIANPNCSTIQMVVALKPLHDAFRVKRVVVSTYQSVSGAGAKGLDELHRQTVAYVSGEEPPPRRNSPTRSRSTASRKSMTSCRPGTPRKK